MTLAAPFFHSNRIVLVHVLKADFDPWDECTQAYGQQKLLLGQGQISQNNHKIEKIEHEVKPESIGGFWPIWPIILQFCHMKKTSKK